MAKFESVHGDGLDGGPGLDATAGPPSPVITADVSRQRPARVSSPTRVPLRKRGGNVGILLAIASLASTTIAARALGMVNQIVISSNFGAGEAMDAYFAAVAAATLFSDLGVAALGYSIVPVYLRLEKAERDDEAARVLSTLLNVVLLLLAGVTVAMLAFPREVMLVFAPGVSQHTAEIGAALLPLVAPTLMLNIATGFITYMLNATGRFGGPALTGMLVPAGTIGFTLALGYAFGVYALGTGLLVGTAAQCLVVVLLARKTKLRYRPVLHIRNREVRTALKQTAIMFIGSAVGLANPVVDQVVVSLLGTGGISWLNYALKIIGVPVGVLFVAAGRGMFPTLSSQAVAGDTDGLKKTLRLFVWLVGLLSLGLSVVIIVFAGPIVSIIFRHGAFTARDAHMTTAVLVGFAIGLCPMAVGFMVPRVFGALNRNDVLLKLAVVTLILNVVLDLALASVLGIPGIALGTSLDYLFSTLALILVLRRLIGPLGLLKPPAELLQWRVLLARVRGRGTAAQ